MTKLEELNMQLSKCEAIKINLMERAKKLTENSKEISIENNKLIDGIKNIKLLNRSSYFLIFLNIIISFLVTNILLDINNGLIYEQLIKILGVFIPLINIKHEIKIIRNNNYKKNILNSKYEIVSQNLFAEEFFLKNTKKDIIDNDKKIFLLNEQINNIKYISENRNIVENNIIMNKEKVLIKK